MLFLYQSLVGYGLSKHSWEGNNHMEELIKAIKAEIARIEKEQLKARAAYGRKAKKAKATS